LVVLPPLLLVAGLRLPSAPLGRRLLRGILYLLVGINLVLITRSIQSGNRELEEFTAAGEAVGRNRTLVVYRPRSAQMLVDYLLHAGAYYYLDSHNIDVRSYEAEGAYWPIRYRADFSQRWEHPLEIFHDEYSVDAILVWDAPADLPPRLSESYRQAYSQGRLRVGRHPSRSVSLRVGRGRIWRGPAMTNVVDTHALVWFFEKNPCLSRAAHNALIDPMAKIIVPTIVLAEIKFLHARGRIVPDLAATLAQLAPLSNCVIYALDKVVLQHLPTSLNIHDALIVGTALVFRDVLGENTALISKDSQIQSSGLIQVIW
jgi:PIN domain nuclease of toxin-antitoxin system